MLKRARHASVSEDEDDEVGTELTMANRENECITDEIVKFLVSINVSVDKYKNSHFRTLLSKVAQHGLPSCLLHEDSLSIQKSLWNLEHVVNQHIIEVKDSWKTTGCTMMMYKLNEGKGSLSSSHKDNLVLGFYSTRGFFFVEGRTLPQSDSLRDALKNHVLNLPIEDVTQAIYHPYESSQPCELSALTPCYGWFRDVEQSSMTRMPCLQQKIYQCFRKFSETSDLWVKKLIKKSEIIHKYILDNDLYIDWVQGEARMAMQKGWYRRLETVMHFEHEVRTWLLCLSEHKKRHMENETEILEIIESHEFWQGLRQLALSLLHLFKVPELLDCLVPTAGYVQVAMNAAVDDGEYDEYEIESKCFEPLLNGDHSSRIQDAATYLSPGFYLYHQEGNLEQIKRVKQGLESIVEEEEKEAMHAELEAYIIRSSNPFANLADQDDHLTYHPVTLWNKYGDGFPVLKKCAIKVLSQPASCMCRQVKKQLSLIEGKDNLILRLNLRMMEEFKRLGDGIYNHVEY